jgi:hypothetical protein
MSDDLSFSFRPDDESSLQILRILTRLRIQMMFAACERLEELAFVADPPKPVSSCLTVEGQQQRAGGD